MIFDTDVLIWCFRGNKKAAEAIQQSPSRAISAVTLMELLQGARDKREQRQIGRFLQEATFTVLPVSENISHRACIYVEEYSLSHSLEMADALIAATAVEHRRPLLTGNEKHYRVVTEIDLGVFRKE